MQEFAYRDGILQAEGLSLEEPARMHGTPLYVYSRRSIVDHCRHLEQAFGGHPHLTCFAVKANGNGTILKTIAGEGLGADVVSGGELHLALAAGFPADRITFSSVGKRDEEIAAGLRAGIRAFNAESLQELEVLNTVAATLNSTARVMLRVNLDIAGATHPYLSTGRRSDKFGIPRTEAAAAMAFARTLPHVEVRGLHSHLGSQIVDEERFRLAAADLLDLVEELRRAGHGVTDLDFGGGFGVQYRGYVAHPGLPVEEEEERQVSAAVMVKALVPILRRSGCALSIQPGRSIVAHAGVLLVRVLYRKVSGDRVFIVVDGGMNDLLRPSLYGAYHQIVPVSLERRKLERVDVVGPLCESGDFLALDRTMPEVRRGELLAVMCTGAYGYALASNYNARPRAAEVMVHGGTCSVIRARETIQDLVS